MVLYHLPWGDRADTDEAQPAARPGYDRSARASHEDQPAPAMMTGPRHPW